MENQVRKDAELTSSAKTIITELFFECGFEEEDVTGLFDGIIDDLLEFYNGWIATSESEKLGFKEFVLRNIDDSLEWEYVHNKFHSCIFSKCVYADKENTYCKYYQKYLNELDDSEVNDCKGE